MVRYFKPLVYKEKALIRRKDDQGLLFFRPKKVRFLEGWKIKDIANTEGGCGAFLCQAPKEDHE